MRLRTVQAHSHTSALDSPLQRAATAWTKESVAQVGGAGLGGVARNRRRANKGLAISIKCISLWVRDSLPFPGKVVIA